MFGHGKTTASADVEKNGSTSSREGEYNPGLAPSVEEKSAILSQFRRRGIEVPGAVPTPVEARTDTRYFNVCTVFGTSMLSLLPIGTGVVPTLFYGLSLTNSFLLIFFFGILFTIPAAYIITIAPRTGMRQMIQSRYSYGYFFNIIITFFTMATVLGFAVIASSLGGQCLAAVSNGAVSVEGGLVIVLIAPICIAFAGYKVLHIYERWAWIPVFCAIIITIGYGGNGLTKQAEAAPVTAAPVINTIALMAGYMITWGNVVGDYAVYMPPNAPKWRLFSYCLFGICTPIILLLTLGAAIGGSLASNPTWAAGYKAYSTGGILAAMLEPAGGFGRFILVLLAFSVVGTCSRELYTISVDFQILIPQAHRIPRVVWVVVTAGCCIGIAIGAVQSFYTALTSFLYFIGYIFGSYVAIVLLEFLWFRKSDALSYDHAIWDSPRRLPPGIAAAVASVLPWGLIVPCMDETWYTGTFAAKVGDLGFEVAIVLTAIFYLPLRHLEIRFRGGVN